MPQNRHDPLPWGELVDFLDRQLQTARASNAAFGLIDLLFSSQLRRIYTAYGHDVGEAVVAEFVARVRDILRPQDAIVRGGERELFVVLPGLMNHEHALLAANRLAELASRPLPAGDAEFNIDMTAGIAVAPEHADTTTELVQRARQAQEHALSNAKPFASYSELSSGAHAEALRTEQEFRRALRANEITVVFQPLVDIQHDRVKGMECLARWNNSRRGWVPAQEFVDIAERSGLIGNLTQSILKTAFRQFAEIRERWPDLTVSVNISAGSLLDEYLADELFSTASIWGVPLTNVIVEITETAMMGDPSQSRVMLDRLRDLGVQVAIDDFGTGYSSLQYLKDLPIDFLKIDKSFVQSMSTDGDESIVKAVAGLAKSFDMSVVAEGVEDEDTLRRLHALGCRYIQGYLFSRPLALPEFMAWLEQFDQQFGDPTRAGQTN